MAQCLYIIECQGYYKIGVATDIESRLAQLSTGNPFPLKVNVLYKFDNAEPVERALHQRYKESRQRGEWFKLSYDDLKNIHLFAWVWADVRLSTARMSQRRKLKKRKP